MKKQLFRGFSLLESLLVLLIAVLASIGLYQVFSPSSTQAAIKQEQKHMESLVDGVFNAYTTSNNFSSISTQTVAGLLNVPLSQDGQSLKTALNTVSATVRPSTTISANDSFDVVYSGPTSKECIGLVKAISPLSNGVFIGSNATIQETDGKISNETDISTFCNQSSMSTVTFRFVGQKNNFTSTSMNSCVCAPTSETQNIACPTGSSGTITQRRTGLCTGGTPACPSLAWSSWSTILNTCAVDGSTVTPTGPAVVVPPQTCIPSVETQTLACPVGQVGGILQQRSRSCPSNTWSSWVQVSSSCQVDTTRNTCTPRTVQSSRACPSGQGGQETVEQTSVCDTNGNETWGALKLIGSTCTASCVSTGTCCVVGRQNQTVTGDCGIGRYGRLSIDQTRTSTCISATATPVWPSTWIDLRSSGCNACPANTTSTATRYVSMTDNCPAGQIGVISWDSNQVQTTTSTYSCNSQPNITTLPPANVSVSTWIEVSRSNEVNTCAIGTCSGASSETQWVPQSSSCPVGQVGLISWEKEQSRTRSCQNVVPPAYWSAWGPWLDTGLKRNNSNTCTTIPSSSCKNGKWRKDASNEGYSDSGATYKSEWSWYDAATGQSGNTWPSGAFWNNPCSVGSNAHYEWDDGYAGGGTFGFEHYICEVDPSVICPVVCTPPASSSVGITRTVTNENQVVACPAGQTGSITQTRTRTENGTRTTSWTCPGPTSSTADTWLGTYNYGGWTQTGNTCVAACTPPPSTNAPITRSVANENQTVACPAGQTGSITQTRTRTENGNRRTTWTCPGPTSSTTDTWLGTYNYGGWTTTSNTCVATPTCVPPGDFTVIKTYWYCTNSLNNSGLYIPGDIPAMGTSYPSSGWVCQRFNGTGQNLNPGGRPFGAVIGYTWEYGATSGTVIIEFTPNPSSSMYHQVMLSNPGGRTDNGGSGVFIRGTVPPGKWVQGLQYPSATTILASGWNTSWGDRACP